MNEKTFQAFLELMAGTRWVQYQRYRIAGVVWDLDLVGEITGPFALDEYGNMAWPSGPKLYWLGRDRWGVVSDDKPLLSPGEARRLHPGAWPSGRVQLVGGYSMKGLMVVLFPEGDTGGVDQWGYSSIARIDIASTLARAIPMQAPSTG